MFHYIYVGHFRHHGDFITVERQPDGGPRLVVERPLDMRIVDRILEAMGVSRNSIPDAWDLDFSEEGYIVWEWSRKNSDAVNFVATLQEQTGCDIGNYSLQSFMTSSRLREVAAKSK